MTRLRYFPMERGPCAPADDVMAGWCITSFFGNRVDPITGTPGSGHGGQDMAFAGCRGAEVYAPSDGTVAMSWDSSGGGNWAGITLDDGSYIGIGHCLDFVGSTYRRVAAGDLIAHVDSTGGSTGDHVHIAYRPVGSSYYSDPYDLLNDAQHRIVGEEPDVRYPTEDMTMIRNASDGGVYVLVMDAYGTLGWKLLNGEQATALDGLGFADLEEVGKGNDDRDRYFGTFPIFA